MRKINIIVNLQQNRIFVEGPRNLAEVCDIPIAEKESCCNTALYLFLKRYKRVGYNLKCFHFFAPIMESCLELQIEEFLKQLSVSWNL